MTKLRRYWFCCFFLLLLFFWNHLHTFRKIKLLPFDGDSDGNSNGDEDGLMFLIWTFDKKIFVQEEKKKIVFFCENFNILLKVDTYLGQMDENWNLIQKWQILLFRSPSNREPLTDLMLIEYEIWVSQKMNQNFLTSLVNWWVIY